jgi:hypothetical protein
MTDKEVMQQALEALEGVYLSLQLPDLLKVVGPITALREALAQPEQKPLTGGEIYTAYITAANQTLRPQDERIAFAFARAIEAAHGIKEGT